MEEAPWVVALGANPLNAGLEAVARARGARLLVIIGTRCRSSRATDTYAWISRTATECSTPSVRQWMTCVLRTPPLMWRPRQRPIHAAYGLRRPTPRALAVARHKPTMNAAWRAEGLLDKRFATCGDLANLIEFHRIAVGGSIVKPAAAASSRGVSVVASGEGVDALSAAWVRARDHDPTGEVFVEEYVPGIEFSVEMVGDSAGHVQVLAVARKYHSANAGRNRIAAKIHYNPPDVSAERQARIGDFGRSCFRSFGLRSSLGHLELIERRTEDLCRSSLAPVPADTSRRTSSMRSRARGKRCWAGTSASCMANA